MSKSETRSHGARKVVTALVGVGLAGALAIPTSATAVELFQKVLIADQTTGAVARVDGDAVKTVAASSLHPRHWQHSIRGASLSAPTLYGPGGGAVNLTTVVVDNANLVTAATVHFIRAGYLAPTSNLNNSDCDQKRGSQTVLKVTVPPRDTVVVPLVEPLRVNTASAYDVSPYRACLIVSAPPDVTVSATGFSG